MVGNRPLLSGSALRYGLAHFTLSVSVATKRPRWGSYLRMVSAWWRSSARTAFSVFFLRRLSAASRMSVAVFDTGIRSTGHFEIATKVDTLTFREVCLLFLSMFISTIPALLVGIGFSLFQAWYVNKMAVVVLDELTMQPSGWASAPGFNYKDHGKLSQESRFERVLREDCSAVRSTAIPHRT